MFCRSAFLILFVLSVSHAAGIAQVPVLGQSASAADKAAANDAYQKQDWKGAAEAYKKIVEVEAKNAGAHYRLGVVLLNLGQTAAAQTHLETAMSISPNSVFGLALARAYARANERDKMYATFERSLTLGGISAESLTGETDFAPVKAETRFVEYVKKLDAVANPCRARPEFRQFDFWVGEWAPQNAQGVTVGTSSIQLILKDCIIFENWDTPVSSGKSFSLYNARDGKWNQTWVDASGNITHYVGGLQDGKMILVANTVTNGKKSLARMTFSKLADGSVRQHGENSVDDGKTWSTAYDFKYVPKK